MSNQSPDLFPKGSLRKFFATLIYRFDASLNRHIGGAMLVLLIALGFVIAIAGSLMSIPGWGPENSDIPTPEGWWMSLTRSLDPGTFGADNGFNFRILGLFVTLTGILAVAIVIGLISNAVDRRINFLRSGRTEVMEKGHFLILGWSNKTLTVVDELVSSTVERKVRIVILARQDKDEIEEILQSTIPRDKLKQVVVRTGDYTQLSELVRVKPIEARSIVVINEDSNEGDAIVVRTVMSLLRIDPELSKTPVITEVRDHNIANALSDLCGAGLSVVNTLKLVSRITAQTLRNPGLSSVYEDLLNFDGDEIYLIDPGELSNSTFQKVQSSIVAGIALGIESKSGEISISPEKHTVVQEDDKLIVLAKDEKSIHFNRITSLNDFSTMAFKLEELSGPEHFEILGWSDLGPLVLSQLDAYLPRNSTLAIRYDPKFSSVKLPKDFANFSVIEVEEIDTTNYQNLDRILSTQKVDHIMVFCYREEMEAMTADARTLLTLAQIRHILNRNGHSSITIISELLDVSDVDIAQVATPDDYVVSERLASLLIAQLTTQPKLNRIFSEIFSIGGHDIVFRKLVPTDESEFIEISIVEAKALASEQNQILIGWKVLEISGNSKTFKIQLNPVPMSDTEKFQVDSLILLRNH